MLRDYRAMDADALGRVALAAFAELKSLYSDWPAMALTVSSPRPGRPACDHRLPQQEARCGTRQGKAALM